MKFYILGSGGFMGSRLTEYLKSKHYEVITDRVDVADFASLKQAFLESKPDIVVNLTGAPAYPTIDWCEDHKEETVKINVCGAINATLAALEAGAYPIQMASGCVYNGGPETPFIEDSPPNFFGSFYSRMRIVMQDALKELPVLQLRIRMPVSMYSHPRNFIDKIVSYEKVISIPNSVTLIEDMYPAIEKLATIRPTGLLNLTNDGYIEHKDVLAMYKKVVDPMHDYTAITLQELEGEGGITKAKRSNCVLSNEKAKSLGISMPALDEARLEQIMRTYKESLKNVAR